MESLANFVGYLLLFMILLALATVVLSILVSVGKLPQWVGYISVGVQAVLTFFSFQITQTMGLISLALTGVCLVLVFVRGSSARN